MYNHFPNIWSTRRTKQVSARSWFGSLRPQKVLKSPKGLSEGDKKTPPDGLRIIHVLSEITPGQRFNSADVLTGHCEVANRGSFARFFEKAASIGHLPSLCRKSALNHFRGATFSTDICCTYVFIADSYRFHQMITAVQRSTGHQRQKGRQEKSSAPHGPIWCLQL